MILILHEVIDMVLLLERKPMGAVSAFTCRNLSLPSFLTRDVIADVSLL